MTNTVSETHCVVCKKPGARWVMRVDGGERLPVHKPCGKRAQAAAPEGRTCKVLPSEELRREWDARDFWADKFKSAQTRRPDDEAKNPKPTGQPNSG